VLGEGPFGRRPEASSPRPSWNSALLRHSQGPAPPR
jgi:hypothetical protein